MSRTSMRWNIVIAAVALLLAIGTAGWISEQIGQSCIDVGLDVHKPMAPTPVVEWGDSSSPQSIPMKMVPKVYGPILSSSRKSPATAAARMTRYHASIPRSALVSLQLKNVKNSMQLDRLYIGTLKPTVFYTRKVAPRYTWGNIHVAWKPKIERARLILPSLSSVEQGGFLTFFALSTFFSLLLLLAWAGIRFIFWIIGKGRAFIPERRLDEFNLAGFAAFFLPCVALWVGVYLSSVYPAVMITDVKDQWHQVEVMKLNDHHPVLHTLLIYGLTFGTGNPFITALMQIIALGACVSYACSLLLRAGVPRWTVFAAYALMLLSPRNGTMVVNLWKDTFYGIAVFLFVLLLAHLYLDERTWHNWRNWIASGILLGLIPLLRHNGLAILAGFVVLSVAWFPKSARRRALTMLAVSFFVFFGSRQAMYRLLEVKITISQHSAISIAGKLAAVINNDVPLSPAEYQFLGKLRSFEDRWAYSVVDVVPTIWGKNKFKLKDAVQEMESFRDTFRSIRTRYPLILLRHRLAFSSFIFSPFETDGRRVSMFAMHNDWGEIAQFPQNPWFPSLREALDHGLSLSATRRWNWLFWRPALALYATILGAFVLIRRTGQWGLLVIYAPVWMNTLAIWLAAPSARQRFQFPQTLSAAFLFALAFVALWNEATPVKEDRNRK